MNRIIKAFILIFLINGMCLDTFAESPCNDLLSLVNRPTVADSACVVPWGNAIVEAGIQFQKLLGAGNQLNFPEATFRLGLAENNEFVIVFPNYIHQSVDPQSGLGPATLGIKHAVSSNKDYIFSVEGLFTPPSGDNNFGMEGAGGALNGIISYDFNPQFNLSFMFGVTTQTQSTNAGGGRYTSVNPDVVFSWTPKEKLVWYGEVYGQSKTAPNESAGFNCDAGFLYLLFKNMTVDLEVGQHISGNLNGFEHYIGSGFAVMF